MSKSDKVSESFSDIDRPKNGTLLFRDCAQGYLQTVATEFTPRLAMEFEITVNQWLLPMLGDCEIQSLNADVMRDYIENLEAVHVKPRGSLGRRTITNIRALLVNIVNYWRCQVSFELIDWKDVVQDPAYERSILIDPLAQRWASRSWQAIALQSDKRP